MLKKLMVTAILVCSLPVIANAWTFNTWVKTSGGQIESRNLNPQTAVNGSVFKSYTTHQSISATIKAADGYKIYRVTKGGVDVKPVPTTSYTTTVAGTADQSLYASFAATQLSLTASATNNPTKGSVTPSAVANIYYGMMTTAPIVFKFTPSPGYFVSALSGLTAFATADQTSFPAPLNKTVTVTIPKGTSLTSGVNLVGTFATNAVIAKAGVNQTVLTGKTVTLDGTASVKADSYSWTLYSGPSTVTLVPTTLGKATVTIATAGTYRFKLVATGAGTPSSSTAYTTVVVTANYVAAMTNQCINCHNGNGIGVAQSANWANSSHGNPSALTSGAMCYDCHIGTNTGGHPGATVTSATCESCHTATLTTTTHPVALTASKCISCHDPHNPAAGIANLAPSAHPAVTLYTFEEIGMQMAGGAKVPVQVDANGKGMPYSPKQTCGTSGCHVKNGVDYTYDKISDHAFHSNQGRSEYQDSSDGKFNATKNKPWTQSTAMVGKW